MNLNKQQLTRRKLDEQINLIEKSVLGSEVMGKSTKKLVENFSGNPKILS